MLIFRPLFDPVSCTYTYLLGDAASGEALIVDPVFEQVARDLALLRELDLRLVATLDTHVHADHVTGAWRLRQRSGAAIALAAGAAHEGVDRPLHHGDRVAFGTRHVEVRATPGHTSGCLTFVLDDHSRAFTGDCLLVRGCGRTDFQQGNAQTLFRSVHEQIFSLPAEPIADHQFRAFPEDALQHADVEHRRQEERQQSVANQACPKASRSWPAPAHSRLPDD